MLLLGSEILSEAAVIVQMDGELLSVATDDGIEAAGLLLNLRAEPDVENAAAPPFWKNVKAEIRTLLCTDDKKYDELRKKMKAARSSGEKVGIPVITGVVATYIRLDVALLTPFVSLVLLSVGQITVEAWCATGPSNDKLILPPN